MNKKKNNLGLPKEFKVKIYQKKIPKCSDSFWYDGDIALIRYKDREVMIVAAGDIRIQNKNGEIVHDGCKERGSGIPGGLKTDKDLEQIGSNYDDKYYWENNNWFEFLWKSKGDDAWQDIMGDVEYTYDEAVRHSKWMLKDEKFWMIEEKKQKESKEK